MSINGEKHPTALERVSGYLRAILAGVSPEEGVSQDSVSVNLVCL